MLGIWTYVESTQKHLPELNALFVKKVWWQVSVSEENRTDHVQF